jgi:hypothetical protein
MLPFLARLARLARHNLSLPCAIAANIPAMTAIKALPILMVALAAQSNGVAAAQAQGEQVTIVVDQNCSIQPDSAPEVLGDHSEAFRDSVVCHLESVLASHHVEERIISGNDRDRSLVEIREREFILDNVTADPAVFVVRQDVAENWSVDSDPQPTTMDGSTAVFRVHAEPGQIVRLHVGLRNAVRLADADQ